MDIQDNKEWLNPDLQAIEPNERINGYWFVYMQAANNRYMRFLPYTAAVFPETAAKKGIMESPLVDLTAAKEAWNRSGAEFPGNVLLKNDAALPVYGSTWARGGIHAVLQMAEQRAQRAQMLKPTEKYGKVNSDEFRELFSKYTICVERGDDLGRSAILAAEKLGFRTAIKEKRSGIVPEAAPSEDEKNICFLIPEDSESIAESVYFGLSSAAMRFRSQLRRFNIEVDRKHPLFVYIPCENGMIPSAITFGLKQLCLNNVHCFFVEKAENPAVQKWMIRQAEEADEMMNQTEATAGIPEAAGNQTDESSGILEAAGNQTKESSGVSEFACDLMKYLTSGGLTVGRDEAEEYARLLAEQTGITLPASSCLGFKALTELNCPGSTMEEYIERNDLRDVMGQATHVIWAIGGAEEWN